MKSPRARRFALLVLAACSIVVMQAHAQSVEHPPTAGANEVDPAQAFLDGEEAGLSDGLARRIEGRWMRRQALIQAGDRASAAFISQEVLELAAAERVRRLPFLAMAAMAEGAREEQSGNATNAVESYRLARALDSHLAAGYWGEARILFHTGGESKRVLTLAIDALKAQYRPSWALYADGIAALRMVLLAAVVAGAAFVIVLLLRHGRRVAATFGAFAPRRWHPAWAAAIGWSIVLLPLATIVLGVWAILAWVVLLAPAFSGAERRLVLAWLVLLVVAAPASRALALLEEAPTREDVRVASTAAERTLTPSLVRDLARLALERPHEAIWRVLLAEACAERYPDRAVLLLRDAARLDPRDPRIRVSLGNVFFRLGKHETAGVHYREALDLDRANVAALLNLSKVRLAEFDFAGAEALSEDARRADAALFERVVSALGEGEVADPEVPAREVRSHVMRSIVVPSLGGRLRFANTLSFAALAAMLGFFAVGLRAPSLAWQTCTTCGIAFDLGGVLQDEPTCTACSHVISRREGLAPAAREEQIRRIDRYMGLLGKGRAIGQVLWPGTAVVHEGRAGLGLIEMSLFVLLVLMAALAAHPLPGGPLNALWTPGTVPVAMAALFWLIFQMPGLRPRAPGTSRGR